MRWLTLLGIIVANFVGLFIAIAPGLVTFAEVPPHGIQCGVCGRPEVQQALIHASSAGRSQIVSLIRPQWLTAVAALNIVVVAYLLFRRRSVPDDTFKRQYSQHDPWLKRVGYFG